MAKSSNGESKTPKSTTRRRVAKTAVPSEPVTPNAVPSAPATASDTPRSAALEAVSPNSSDVQRRAYELFLQRGGRHGSDLEDWYEAERQLRSQRRTLPRA